MVSMPARYDEIAYEFSPAESRYAYPDDYTSYTFNQAPPQKHFLPTSSIHFEPFLSNAYPNWTGVATDTYYLPHHQILQEQHVVGHSYDETALLFMAKYHIMEHEFNTGIQSNSGFLPGFSPENPSPDDVSINISSHPQAAWSPPEPSVASLSPPYEPQWDGRDPETNAEYPLGDAGDEVLQGLGLYDCPELASEYKTPGELYSSCPSLGRGLKLEESFEFKEEDSDCEEEEDEEDEEEYDDE
ncbi:hypothetical protein TWF730_009483 [Orbilia blumenaviensis]|uniref:Uncharacterized protein n=1 Tax=Orbilia blumenaviensis TaxID=1796055 RepID=A0AAV9UZP0_9PEZI